MFREKNRGTEPEEAPVGFVAGSSVADSEFSNRCEPTIMVNSYMVELSSQPQAMSTGLTQRFNLRTPDRSLRLTPAHQAPSLRQVPPCPGETSP